MDIYECLLCPAKCIGRAAVAAHVSAEHPVAAEEHHLDELSRKVTPPPADRTPPFVCLMCKDGTSYFNETSVVGHLVTAHDHSKGDSQIGVHYCSSIEWHVRDAERQKAERRDIERAFKGTASDPRVEKFALVLDSVRGVADFLTECGDQPAPSGA